MTRFTFLTWDGGGNLAPAVGIAQELIERGNEVGFLGYLPQQAAIESRGLAFSALPRSGNFDLYGKRAPEERLPAIIRNVWACPEHLDDIPDARDLLDRPSFREAAARLGGVIRAAPGAAGAADVLEELARDHR